MSADYAWVIHRYDRVPSTMDVAARLAHFGAPDRTAVISAEQTAGRGRAGRVWQAPPGSAVFCTLILRPGLAPDRLSTLPLVTGVAVAEAIEDVTGQPVQLKWPNDVWLGADPERRKVAGILVTTTLHGGTVDLALVGIGINVASGLSELPPGATSLFAVTGVRIATNEVFERVLDRIAFGYEAFLESGGKPSLAGWRARAALLGEQVTIEDGGRNLSGNFTGIDDDGALLLQDSSAGIRRVVAGDLTRGPRAAGRNAAPAPVQLAPRSAKSREGAAQ